jgi:ribosomal-protein-alanine N-acetyltransferase
LEGVTIRKAIPSDIPQVLLIETASFSTPWSENTFRYEVTNDVSIFRVALFINRAIGYVCLRTYIDVAEILNLAVLPEFRRKGVGSLLLLDALNENRRAHPGIRRYLLEVRNQA